MAPSLRLNYVQDDNIRMTLQPHNTVHGSIIAPRLGVGRQSEAWGMTGSAEVARKRYSGEPDLDRDFKTFRLSSLSRMERSSFTLNASRVDDATVSEDQADTDVGRTTAQKSRRLESVQPAWSWSITERAQAQLSYQLSEASYVDGESVGLYDYQNRAVTATWSYLLSPRSQFFLTADYSKFRVPDTNIQSQAINGSNLILSTFTDVDSRTPAFRVGLSHTFSETMRGALTLGRRKTTTERSTITDVRALVDLSSQGRILGSQVTDNVGTTYSGDLNKKFDGIDVTATISRDITASGVGAQVERDALNLRLDHPFTARLKGSLVAGGSESRRIDDVASAATDIEQYSIQPALHWRWSQEADLSLSYRYNHLKRAQEAEAARSRAINLTFDYAWPKFSISR